MPFLALDENLQFSNVKKIWVYFIAAVASTILTFVASWAWDRLLRGPTDTQVNQPSQPHVEDPDANDVAQVDAQALELKP